MKNKTEVTWKIPSNDFCDSNDENNFFRISFY